MARTVNRETIEHVKRWAYIRSADECWPYRLHTFVRSGTGACVYGQVSKRQGDGERRAHRAAWKAAFGPIPTGVMVCHRCDNPLCCNPAHLFLGSAIDNNRDKLSKGRHRSPIGEHNGLAKLTDADAAALRLRALAGERQQTLADVFGVSRSLVSMIKNGKARAWLAQ